MPAPVDEKGLLSDTNRFAAETELFYIFIELIQNRKWNDDKSIGKFVFATFDIQGKRYLVIGYNHFRSEQTIENEHTPFNWRKTTPVNGEATIATRGYGAKLLPFKIGGQYSNYYHLKNSEIFPEDLSDWGMKQSINITKLQERLNSENDIDSHMHEYRETYINPCNSKDGVIPELLINGKFTSSELYSFFKKENFKYFYIFSAYSVNIDTSLDSTLQRLANLYEGNTAEIYQSKGLSEPKLLTTTIENSLGLNEKCWAGEFTLEWMLGERDKDGEFWKNICRYYNKHTGEEVFSKLGSNGSTGRKLGIRHNKFSRSDLDSEWIPDIRVTVAMTSNEYEERSKLNGTEIAFRVHMNIQGDIIDDIPSDFDLKSKIRYLPAVSRARIILYVLSDNAKNNDNFGLTLGHLKKNSSFSKSGAIYEMMSQTLLRAKDFYTIVTQHLLPEDASDIALKDARKHAKEIGSLEAYKSKKVFEKFTKCMRVDKVAADRSVNRKREGIKYETIITKALDQGIKDIEWDHKDSHISAEHGLNGEGIDSLGATEINGKTLWIAIQVKDKENRLGKGDKDKFINTLNEFKAKYPEDICLSYLVLKQDKSFTAKLSIEMRKNDIDALVDPDGSMTVHVINNQITKLLSIIS